MNKIILLISLLAIASCGHIKPDEKQSYPVSNEDARRVKNGKITGVGGLKLFGRSADSQQSIIGVNQYIWRSALDVLSFIPLASVDPSGGVIISDYYEDPDARGEKFKINVLILNKELRASAVRVSVFRKKLISGKWVDAKVNKKLERELEEKILTRARELKIKNSQL